jgi:hypothetical protein
MGLFLALGTGCGPNVLEFSTTRELPTPLDGSTVRDAAADAPEDAPMPTELPMTCDGATPQVTLVLPCAVGMSPINATECYLSGAVDPRYPALDFLVHLDEVAQLVYQRLDIASHMPIGPASVLVSGKRFAIAKIEGTVVFHRVDPVGRSFDARLESMSILWTADDSATLTCFAADAPFWAVPGNFL